MNDTFGVLCMYLSVMTPQSLMPGAPDKLLNIGYCNMTKGTTFIPDLLGPSPAKSFLAKNG